MKKRSVVAFVSLLLCVLWVSAEVFIPVSVTGSGSYHNDAGLIIDGIIPAEKTAWDDSKNVWWQSDTTVFFTVDLGEVKQVDDICVSVDNNDDYKISYSENGNDYLQLTFIDDGWGEIDWYDDWGMDTFCTIAGDVEYVVNIDFSAVDARYIRIQCTGGDNSYSIGELQIIGESLQLEQYTLVVNSGTGGGLFTNGTQVAVDAVAPGEGYVFSEWIAEPEVFTNNLASQLSVSTTFDMPASNVTLTAVYLQWDSDLDGMDDTWEIQYFGNLDQTADGDFDADGRTNGEEEGDGTDPMNAGSTLGLVAYYPFNGNADDESGNGNNGIIYGPTLVNDRFDIENRSYRFDGYNDMIRIPNSETINIAGNITLCAWVKTEPGGHEDPRILHKQNAYQLFGSPGRAAFYVSGPGYTTLSAPAPGLIEDTWQLLVGVADGSYWRLYIDGVEVASIICAQGASQSSDLLSIGLNDWNSDKDDFCGSLDDIRIYNRALSSNEVVRLYESSTNAPPVYYQLTVNSGSEGGSYTNGQHVAVSADDPEAGHNFSCWTTEPPQYTNNLGNAFAQNTTLIMPAADVTLTANYSQFPDFAPWPNDEYTVLLDHLDGSSTGTVFGTAAYSSSIEGLDQAAVLSAGMYIRYSLASWSTALGGTVDMWVNPSQYPAKLMCWNKYAASSPPSSGYVLHLELNSEGKLHYSGWGGDFSTEPVGERTVPLNVWTHVGVTWGPNGTTLYVNGTQDAYISANAYPSQNYMDYAYLNYWGESSPGLVDEVRISNVQRSAQEFSDYFYGVNFKYALVVENGSGSASYYSGESVDIVADEPAEGHAFTQWTVDPSDFSDRFGDVYAASTVFAMPSAMATLTANYAVKIYTVQFDLAGGTHSGGGTLNQQVEHGAYAQEPIVTAPAGYSFVRWNTALGPITSDCTITAVYEQIGSYWHTVNFNLGTHGTHVGGGELSQLVAHANAAVAPELTADEGWIHSGWSASFNTVLANLEIYAVYTRDPAYKQLTVISSYGTPSPSAGSSMYVVGEDVDCSMPVMVISNAAAIYTCTGWSADDGSSGTGPTAALSMDEDVVLTWIWEVQYYLNVNTSGPGGVDVLSGYYPAGTAVPITATPQAGYEFQGWSGAASGMNPLIEITIAGAKAVTATFGEHLVEADILELSPDHTVLDSAVTFRGSAGSSGGATITQYRWRMIKLVDGLESGDLIYLSDQSVFIRDDLPEGRWRICFDAQDSTEAWSAIQTAEICVENPAFLTDLAISRSDMRFFAEDGTELDPMMANQVCLGDRISVEVMVHDEGGVDATNSVIVSLFDGKGPANLESHADDAGLLGTNVISAIPAGGSTKTLIEWHVGYDIEGNVIEDCDGTFRLLTALAEFQVNRDQAALNAAGAQEELPVYEASLLNNAGQASILIGEVALDDYTMSVTLPSVSLYEDHLVVISGYAHYEWLDDGSPNEDAVLGAVVQVTIDGRVLTTKTYSPDGRFSVNAGYMDVGDYDVQAQVDDGTLTATAQAEVHVNALITPPDPQAELSVVAVDVAGPGMYETESTMPHTLLSSNVTLSATIKNSGDLTAVQPFSVRFFVNDDSNVIGTATVTNSLNPGASCFVVCPAIWSTNIVGTYSVYAEVDSDHQVNEKIETNNQRSLAVAVHEGLPDLRPYYVSGYVVNTLSVSPASPVQGEVLTLGTEIFNAGPVPMTEKTFSVVFYANGTPVAETNVTTSLICGESIRVNLPWDTSAVQPGMFDLSVDVDVDDVVREDFENNNSARISFELLPAVPVLILDEVESSRNWVYAGDYLALTALIRNAGGADYESGSTLWLSEETLASTVSGVAVGPLGVGRSMSLNMSWQAPEESGRVLLLVSLDGVVKELSVYVYAVGSTPPPTPPSADPGLYSGDISIPGEWTRGDQVYAQAVIHNLGDLPSTNVLAQFYYSVDSVGYIPLGTAQLTGVLSAGATTTLVSTATFDAVEPYYTVKVRLTPSGGNRLTSNDAATRSFAIEAPWADAGSDRITVVGYSVVLDGTASQYATVYSWEFSAMPVGSSAVLSGADTAQPSFVPDLPGTYEVRLQVSDGELYSPYAWATVVVRAPVAATLTVASDHGAPTPAVGTHSVTVGDTISASVDDVMPGGTNWICAGWTGSGITPESGSTKSVDLLVVDELPELTWLWTANYLVDVIVSGSGTVVGINGYLPAGTQVVYDANAADGFVFAEWIGDINGCVVNTDMLTMPVDKARTVSARFLPLPVATLNAQVKTLEKVQLSWSYNGLSSAEFLIERLTGGATEWQVVGNTGDMVFVDNTVTEGMSMFYRVSAVVGPYMSNPVGTQAEVPNLPFIPGNVGAFALSSEEVFISWQPPLYAAGYNIQRRELPLGEWMVAASVGNVQTWVDTGVIAGGRYAYRVRSVNAAGNSAYSSEVFVTIPLDRGNSEWTYGIMISNVVVTVGESVLDPSSNVLCGAEIGGIFDALLSNPDGESAQHRVVAGLRDANGVAVSTVVEINDLTGVPVAPPEWISDVIVPEGLRIPATPGEYTLWVEDFLGESDPCESFVHSTHTNEMALTRKVAEFSAILPQASDVYVMLGAESERAGKTVEVPVKISAMGGENAIRFSVAYDSAKLKLLNVKSCDGASRAYVQVDDTTDGLVGGDLLMPVNTGLEPGLQTIVMLKFQVDEFAYAGSVIDVSFSDSPVSCIIADAYTNLLPHVWYNGTVTVSGEGYEADVVPHGKPNGAVDDKDKRQILRFATGLDTPAAGAEFQRADCAPIDTLGDGQVDVRDVVIAGYYAEGVEALRSVGGPTEPSQTAVSSLDIPMPLSDSCSVGILSTIPNDVVLMGLAGLLEIDAGSYALRGGILEVPVNLVSGGNIEGVSFSIRFDPGQVAYLDTVLSPECSAAVCVLNAENAASGTIGFALRMPRGSGIAAGSTTVITLRFRVSPAASDVVTQMEFTEDAAPVILADGSGTAVSASVQGASIYLAPASIEGAPDPVTDLVATLENMERVRLSWSDVADETSYKLYRRSDSEIWGLLTELSDGTESYIDSGLQPGVTYFYRIVTLNAVAESSSDPVTITVPTRYNYWASENIGMSLTEPDADADGDGIKNYLEFLMGSDPANADIGLLRMGYEDLYDLGDNYFTLSFDVKDWAVGSVSADTTEDLRSGEWISAVELGGSVSNGIRRIKFRTQYPFSESSHQFIRLKTER